MTDFESGGKILRGAQRVLWALLGVGVFFWVGYEDRTIVFPVLLGSTLALVLALKASTRITPGASPARMWAFTLLGLLAGTVMMPLAALSMLVKVSLHAHVPPEFSLAQVMAVLGRTPIWGGAGALAGLAVGLLEGKAAEE